MSIRRAIPNVRSGDLQATSDFYHGFLGFDVAMNEQGFLLFASPDNRTAQVTAAAKEGPGDDIAVRQVDISVEVADVEAAYIEAARRGLEIVYPLTHEAWGIRRFFVRDPDGSIVNVNSHLELPHSTTEEQSPDE